MEGYRLGPVLTDKVISVVKRVEDMPYRYGNASIPVRFEDDGFGGGGTALRMGRFHGQWPKSTTKSVSLYGDNGEVITVRNFLADLTTGCGWRKCIVAELTVPKIVGNAETNETESAWTLISAEVA